MAITTLSMVLTVCVLNLHHMSDRPVPGWVHRLVLQGLATCLRMHGIKRAHQKRKSALTQHANGDVTQRRRKQRKAMLMSGANGSVLEIINENAEGFQRDAGLESTPLQQLPQNAVEMDKLERCSPLNYSAIHEDCTAERDEPKVVDFSKEWTRVAEILDRFFFVVFLLSILISTGVLFHPLTGLVATRPALT